MASQVISLADDEMPFEDDAEKAAKEIADEFGRALAIESSRIARNANASTVTVSYVQQAAQKLGAGGDKLSRLATNVGGVLLGAGLSTLFAIASDFDDPTIESKPLTTAVFAIVAVMAGCVLSTIGHLRDR